jgi:hypothetical protein
MFQYGVHIPHFTTCPDADEFRKKSAAAPNPTAPKDDGPRQIPADYFDWAAQMEALGIKRKPGDDK